MDTGTLYIVATPIGNREDITLRALNILASVSYIACEDTRRTGMLLKYYQTDLYSSHLEQAERAERSQSSDRQEVDNDKRFLCFVRNDTQKLISFYDQVEEEKTPEIIELLQSGNDVALVSDAGTPLIADPGFKLVRECHTRNITVSPIPGPSSLTASLSVSGMPTDKFLFLGYLPKKKGKRLKILQGIEMLKNNDITKTIVLFETIHRIEKTLKEIHAELGNVEIAICSELTKIHERVEKGSISDLIKNIPENIKGEYVVVL